MLVLLLITDVRVGKNADRKISKVLRVRMLHKKRVSQSVAYLGVYAFNNCTSLSEINIPESITEIEWGIFNGCTKLTNVIIPESVKSFGDWAFGNCMKLKDVYMHGLTPPEIGYNLFDYYYEIGLAIHVPSGALETYKNANRWSSYANYIVGDLLP